MEEGDSRVKTGVLAVETREMVEMEGKERKQDEVSSKGTREREQVVEARASQGAAYDAQRPKRRA